MNPMGKVTEAKKVQSFFLGGGEKQVNSSFYYVFKVQLICVVS